jgi:hypothetical protein
MWRECICSCWRLRKQFIWGFNGRACIELILVSVFHVDSPPYSHFPRT